MTTHPSDTLSAIRLSMSAAAVGLVTGATEVTSNFIVRQTLEGGSRGGPLDAIWMAPLVESIILGSLAYVLGFAVRRMAPERRFRVSAFVILWVAFVAILSQFWHLHAYAAVALAGGLAMRFSELASRRESTVLAVAPRALSAGLVTVGVVAIGLRLLTSQLEQRQLAELPPAPTGAPNIILVTLDTVRAEHLSLHGYGRPTTPNLERLAATGTVFDAAFATSSWTLPSHASLFTGRYPSELSYGWTKRLSTQYPLLAQELRRHGYETAAFVGNVQYASSTAGLGAGVVHFEDYPTNLGQAILSSALARPVSNAGVLRRAFDYHEPLNRRRAPLLNDRLLRWLASRKAGRPFYVFINYYDAHDPLLPPAPFDRKFGPTRPSGTFVYEGDGVDPSDRRSWGATDVQRHVNAYDASIAYLDEQFGRLMAALARQSILENTLIVVTADHGELLGENGLYGHGQTLHAGALHVPLLMTYPKHVPAGTRISAPVTLRDVAATVMDIVGLSGDSRLAGFSLAHYWQVGTTGVAANSSPVLSHLQAASFMPSHYPAAQSDMTSVIWGSRHYIRHSNGREDIFDWRSDPDERRNLAGTEPFPAAMMFAPASRPKD